MVKSPRENYRELFEHVQNSGVFADSKTFVDAVARSSPEKVLRRYRKQRSRPGFDLKRFVESHFHITPTQPSGRSASNGSDLRVRIDEIWDLLTRPADPVPQHSSLIALPKPYIVPGGRFREMYYWDSYFTMLGLAVSGKSRLIENMVENFACLIDRFGLVPNGTRSYLVSRSQPPVFALMVELHSKLSGDQEVFQRHLPQLKREYDFWMAGADELRPHRPVKNRVLEMNGALLNRYWDESQLPREESYLHDVALAARAGRKHASIYRDLRAACESGWDFSSRWFAGESIDSIRTTDLIPIDLNCILYKLESVLAETCRNAGHLEDSAHYRGRAIGRRKAIQSMLFDEQLGFFVDLNIGGHGSTGCMSLAAAFPLFFGIATPEQAGAVKARLESDFLWPGGWVTTLNRSGQQWDAPNGWAPLQWIVFQGLRRYGYEAAAAEGASRWLRNVERCWKSSGRFLEKYDVERPGRLAVGGEYYTQEGFGWTNGVYLALRNEFGSGNGSSGCTQTGETA